MARGTCFPIRRMVETGVSDDAPARRASAWLLLALVVVACSAERAGPLRPETDRLPSTAERRTIFVTSNGWHSSIVLARADLPPGRIPEAADFAKARFLEFGWGDAEYYPAKNVTLGMTLRAAVTPTPSVVHVAGMAVAPGRRYPGTEVVPLALDAKRLGRLVDFIDATFDRRGRTRATSTGPGLYPDSRFYPATGQFHLLNTCNTWTASGLAAAGFDVADPGMARAEALMRQVRRLRKRR